MYWYKTRPEDDPYQELWSRPGWLDPLGNADSLRFPLVVTVEPTNACNNKCLYCSRHLMDRKIGYLSLETMDLIAAEAGQHKAAIRHGGFGEPLLHPRITEIVDICKKHGVLTTIFSNCRTLTEEQMRSFVEAGLDEIRFSSSGISPEEHNTVRLNSNYKADFEDKLILAHKIREEMGASRPFLTVYTNVLDYDAESFTKKVDAYRDRFLRYADKVDIDLTMFSRVKDLEHVKEFYERQTINQEHKDCLTLYLKVIVHWSGDVYICDCAYNHEPDFHLGRVGEPGFSIQGAYKSEKVEKLRQDLSFNRKHHQYALCRDCFSNTNKWSFTREAEGDGLDVAQLA